MTQLKNLMFGVLSALAFGVFLLSAATAQQETDEQPYLEKLLGDLLSSPAMQVRITGLNGTFSSAADVKQIEFFDPDGPWMRIENAKLIWTRSALLQGRVDIDTIEADKIMVLRLPVNPPSDATPEARDYRLPELPVSVQIGDMAVREFILANDILGHETSLRLGGDISLKDGKGALNFTANHLDGSGSLEATITLDNQTDNIDVELNLREQADGLLTTILGTPDRPSVALQMRGKGPLDDFTINLALETDETPRVLGEIKATPLLVGGEQQGTQYSTELIGDLAPLFAPAYQAFFGQEALFQAVVKRPKTGETELSDLYLETAAMMLAGDIRLAADGTPVNIRIKATLDDPENETVVLPLSGEPTSVRNANLDIVYTQGKPWQGTAIIQGFAQGDTSVGTINLRALGDIAPAFLQKKPSDVLLDAGLDLTLQGVDHRNPAMAAALGREITFSGDVALLKDAPIQLRNVTLENGNFIAAFNGTMAGFDDDLTLRGDVSASVDNLSRFSGVIGHRVNGRGAVNFSGELSPLSGAFDVTARARAGALNVNDQMFNRMLRGANVVNLRATRTTQGLFIETLDLTNAQMKVAANGRVASNASALDLSGRLFDSSLISDGLIGALEFDGTVQQEGKFAQVNFNTSGIGGLATRINGRIPIGVGDWDLDITGQAPLALGEGFLKQTQARLRGLARFDMHLNGVPDIPALSGVVTTTDAQVVLPDMRISLNDLNARADITRGLAKIQSSASLQNGGRVNANGTMTLSETAGFPANLVLELRDVIQREGNFYKTRLNGDLNLTGPMLKGPLLSGRLRLSDTEVNVKSQPLQRLSFLPQVIHKNETAPSLLTRKRAGLLAQSGSNNGEALRPIRLDLIVLAPTRVFVRGRGLDAELGGQIRFRGDTLNVLPDGAFNLIRGRIDILGKRFALTEGTLTMIGSMDPRMRIVATTVSDEYTVSAIISGLVSDPKITLESTPDLPEDEILSQMVFGRDLEQISPFQAFQLASGLRELSGKGGIGVTGRLRRKLDLDDFNVVVDQEGDIGVRAGKYLSENVYTTVTIADEKKSNIAINLDVNKNVTLRGRLSEDGKSSIGVFFEKDY